MTLIENIKHNGMFNEGTFKCSWLEKTVGINIDDGVPIAYATKCATHFDTMSAQLRREVCKALKDYCILILDGTDTWSEVDELAVKSNNPEGILKLIKTDDIQLEISEAHDDTGYIIYGDCDWEPEHGFEVLILNDKVVGVGEYAGTSPWSVSLDRQDSE